MASEKLPVIILAGGPTPDPIIEAGETEKMRAFLDVGDRPMLGWVLDAVRGCDQCGEIMCIGDVERLKSEFGLDPRMVMADKGSMLENFIAGLEHFKSNPLVMQMTCDIPLITPSMLSDLINQVRGISAEVYYPIVDIKYFEEKYPGGKRTKVKLKEGVFTGGNVFFFKPGAVLKNRDKIQAVIRDRKNPAKLIRLFGFAFIVKFFLKMLDLKGLEKKASQILGATMRGVLTPHPEIGLDVDKPEDLEMVRIALGRS